MDLLAANVSRRIRAQLGRSNAPDTHSAGQLNQKKYEIKRISFDDVYIDRILRFYFGTGKYIYFYNKKKFFLFSSLQVAAD